MSDSNEVILIVTEEERGRILKQFGDYHRRLVNKISGSPTRDQAMERMARVLFENDVPKGIKWESVPAFHDRYRDYANVLIGSTTKSYEGEKA